MKRKFSKILVTGGAGFIGSHLVDTLMNRGFHVRVVDNLSNGDIRNLDSWHGDSKFEFIKGDLKDPNIARRSVSGVEMIFHFAANPDVRLGEFNPSIHFNENLLVTFNILEAMRKSKKAKDIIFASSSVVYGESDVFPTPENYQPLLPISLYGASKLGCESLVSSYCHTFDFSGVILRFANVVGARATHGVIVDFIRKLKKNPKILEILGDGKQKKSYLHVKDLLSAIPLILNNYGSSNRFEVYNVGSLDLIDVKRIAEIVCDEMGLESVRFKFTGGVDGGRGWKGDVKTMLISTTRLENLGWAPKLNSEQAIRHSCHEFLASHKQ